MARVTVEDCIDKVDNRFDLVLLAAHRARMISSGSQLTIDRDNDKNPVVSLREIAESTISPEDLNLFHFADDPQTAFELLKPGLMHYVEQPETPETPAISKSVNPQKPQGT